jgi:hypothetical protein
VRVLMSLCSLRRMSFSSRSISASCCTRVVGKLSPLPAGDLTLVPNAGARPCKC